jgi:hypothetical protein
MAIYTNYFIPSAYVMNGGTVVAQRNPDGNFYWLHADHLGSGRKMTNTSGLPDALLEPDVMVNSPIFVRRFN